MWRSPTATACRKGLGLIGIPGHRPVAISDQQPLSFGVPGTALYAGLALVLMKFTVHLESYKKCMTRTMVFVVLKGSSIVAPCRQ
jgi:hypothetical protein